MQRTSAMNGGRNRVNLKSDGFRPNNWYDQEKCLIKRLSWESKRIDEKRVCRRASSIVVPCGDTGYSAMAHQLKACKLSEFDQPKRICHTRHCL